MEEDRAVIAERVGGGIYVLNKKTIFLFASFFIYQVSTDDLCFTKTTAAFIH